MIGQQVRCYVLNVATDTDDPMIFGPYTRRKAEKLAEEFNKRIDQEDFGWIYATAQRISNPQNIRQILREFGQ